MDSSVVSMEEARRRMRIKGRYLDMYKIYTDGLDAGLTKMEAVERALELGNPTLTASMFDKYLLISAFEEI